MSDFGKGGKGVDFGRSQGMSDFGKGKGVERFYFSKDYKGTKRLDFDS